MNDVAVLTGGTVISEEIGLTFDKADTGKFFNRFELKNFRNPWFVQKNHY